MPALSHHSQYQILVLKREEIKTVRNVLVP